MRKKEVIKRIRAVVPDEFEDADIDLIREGSGWFFELHKDDHRSIRGRIYDSGNVYSFRGNQE